MASWLALDWKEGFSLDTRQLQPSLLPLCLSHGLGTLGQIFTADDEPPSLCRIEFDTLLRIFRTGGATCIIEQDAIIAFGEGVGEGATDALIRVDA